MTFRHTPFTLLLTASTAFFAFFTPQSATAQMEYMAEAMQPQFMVRDLVIFAEGLNLDDTQEVIVEAMFDSYEDDFQDGWAATQVRINNIAESLRDKPPTTSNETLEPVLNALSDWLIQKRQLDQGLLENVQAILIDQQRELWPGFAQRLYREKHLSRGRLSGESVDLFQTTRETDLSPVAESLIQEQLFEYATALDIAMRNRDAILQGNPKKLFDNILSGNSQRSPNLIESLIRARVEVRDINDRYIEIISGNLSSNDGEDFRTRALKRGYTRIYRRTPAQRIFRQAVENESYSEGLRAQIFQLEASYLQELQIVNFKLLEETRKYEPAMHRHRELAGQQRREGGTPQKLEDPTRKIFKEREELGRKYIEMLRALLSPEEFLELDGARRWIPRSEQQMTNPPSTFKGVPSISSQISSGNSNSRKSGDKTGNGKDNGKDNGEDGKNSPEVIPVDKNDSSLHPDKEDSGKEND